MMLYPSIFGESLFDDLMDFSFPTFRSFDDTDRKLYGKQAANLMKTDVHEQDGQYEIDIDLPGFKKDEIGLELQKGYLTVSASKNTSNEEKDEHGRMIRQERYSGSRQRSFYVGEYVTGEEIKARFEDGVLKLCVPKKDAPKVPEKKTIMIEG
jgi:HSP20 family molecular chaperone IbpA